MSDTQRRSSTRARANQTRTIHGQAAFLRAFARCGNVLRAAQAAAVGRRTVYTWLEEDAAFKRLYDEAHEDAIDRLEEEARRRAHDGVLEPVYQGGRKVGAIKKYSDALLVFLLKGKRPDTFRERTEVSVRATLEEVLTASRQGGGEARR